MQLALLSLRAEAPVVKSILRWASQLPYARKIESVIFIFSSKQNRSQKVILGKVFFIKRILKCF